jgi:conjugal transfer/type IV secretion protein DotA/TraY
MKILKKAARKLVSPVVDTYQSIRNHYRIVRDVIGTTRAAAGEIRNYAKENPDENIDFPMASQRWGVDMTDRAQAAARRTNIILAIIYYSVAAWCVSYGASIIARGQIIPALSSAIGAVTGITCGTACVWRWQVLHERKFVSFYRWLRQGGSVLTVALVAAVAWAVLSASAPVLAQSQPASINLPAGTTIAKATDISANVLSYILGSSVFEAIGGTAVTGGPTWVNPVGGLILQILQVLNLASLTFVSAWILYMWGIFAVATAHQGKELGGGMYNSLWVPARHALSFTLTVPVLQGLSLLQVAALACVCWSINFANVIWDSSAAYIANNMLNPQSITTISTNSLAAEARRMLPMLFQSSVIQSLDATATMDGSTSPYWSSPATIPASDNSNITTTAPDNYTIMQTTPTGMTLALRAPAWAEPSAMGSVKFSYANTTGQSAATIKQLATDRVKAVTDLTTGARALAISYLSTSPVGGSGTPYASTGAESPQAEETLVKAYVDAVQQALTTAASGFASGSYQNEINTALDIQSGGSGGTTIGWMGAGLFAFATSEIQAQLDDALLGEADIRPVDQRALMKSNPEMGMMSSEQAMNYSFSNAMANKSGWSKTQAQVLHEASVWYANQIDHHLTYSATAQADSDGSLLPLVTGVAERLIMSSAQIGATGNGSNLNGTSILSSVLESFAASDPFVVIRAFGDRLISSGYFILGGGAGLSIFGAIISKFTGAGGGVAGLLSSVATTFSLALITCGIIMAFLAPITPFLFWLRALLGWVFLLLETLVAAPFWAIIHAAPQGQGFAGDAGRKGYFMLVDVLLRAPLLVLGAVVSFGIMRVVGWLFYSLFSKWFAAAGTVAPFGLTGDIVYSVVVIAFMYSLAILVYTKGITYFPEKIVKWISDSAAGGLDGDELHQQPSKIVGMAASQTTQIANMASHRLSQGGAGKEIEGGGGGTPKAQLPAQIARRGGPEEGGGGGDAGGPSPASGQGGGRGNGPRSPRGGKFGGGSAGGEIAPKEASTASAAGAGAAAGSMSGGHAAGSGAGASAAGGGTQVATLGELKSKLAEPAPTENKA